MFGGGCWYEATAACIVHVCLLPSMFPLLVSDQRVSVTWLPSAGPTCTPSLSMQQAPDGAVETVNKEFLEVSLPPFEAGRMKQQIYTVSKGLTLKVPLSWAQSVSMWKPLF